MEIAWRMDGLLLLVIFTLAFSRFRFFSFCFFVDKLVKSMYIHQQLNASARLFYLWYWWKYRSQPASCSCGSCVCVWFWCVSYLYYCSIVALNFIQTSSFVECPIFFTLSSPCFFLNTSTFCCFCRCTVCIIIIPFYSNIMWEINIQRKTKIHTISCELNKSFTQTNNHIQSEQKITAKREERKGARCKRTKWMCI